MSIDKTVGAMTEALEVLAAELKEARIAQEKHNLLLKEMLEKVGGAKPARKTRTRKAKAEPKEEPEAATEAAEEAKPARKTRTRKKKAEPEKTEVTVADVTALAAKWLSDTGEDKELRAARRSAIKEICQDLGVTRISMIPEEDAAKAMDLLQAAIDGEAAAADDDEDDLL